jgi:hypothetical protein
MSDMMDIIDKVENSSISRSNTAPTSGNAAKDVPFNLPVINLETFSGSYKDGQISKIVSNLLLMKTKVLTGKNCNI